MVWFLSYLLINWNSKSTWLQTTNCPMNTQTYWIQVVFNSTAILVDITKHVRDRAIMRLAWLSVSKYTNKWWNNCVYSCNSSNKLRIVNRDGAHWQMMTSYGNEEFLTYPTFKLNGLWATDLGVGGKEQLTLFQNCGYWNTRRKT